MANDWAVKNTSNGLFLTVYNSDPTLCGWGNVNDHVNFSEQDANAEAQALNNAYGVDSFIGTHPKPH